MNKLSFSDASFLGLYLQCPKGSRKYMHKKYKKHLSKEARKLLVQIDKSKV